MAIKPQVKNLNATSAEIVNVTVSNMSAEYAGMIPKALVAGNMDANGNVITQEQSVESLRQIGSIIMQYQPIQNAFLTTLVNRIGKVVLQSKLYDNPWAMFKRGLLEYGETIEEIFVNIAKPHQYDPLTAETEVFKREIPDVLAAFHTMNYQKFYKSTVSNDQLRQAFLSWTGISDLITKIIEALYTGANYDEFITMKYLIGRVALAGNIVPVTVPTVNADNARSIVTSVKSLSNKWEFMSSSYNIAGVKTYSNKSDQFLIMTSDFNATVDVEVLSLAFNMDKSEFMGHSVLVDSFAPTAEETERLDILFAENSGYIPFTDDEITKLESIPAIMVDRNWFMIFDNFYNMTDIYNGEGLYFNYFYHVWKTFSVSPYANSSMFTTLTNAITAVSVTPETATVAKGSSIQLSSEITGTGFVNKNVLWSIDSEISSISVSGLLTVSATETAATITVTATSIEDSEVTGTAIITVSGG